MKTASHFTYQGVGRVSISRSQPRHGAVAGYHIYRPLAPGPWFNSVNRTDYEKLFNAQLAGLDAKMTWDKLHALAGEGNEPVLLCFEKPPFTEDNWCHRRMVAAWFERELGVQVPELEPPRLVPDGKLSSHR